MNRPNHWALSVCLLLCVIPGCIGIRTNKENFLNDPEPGTSVEDMLTTYGKPDFVTTVGDKEIYVYRIVDEGYYVVVGVSGSVDLVVTCEDGEVVESRRVKLGQNMAILYPVTWQVE